METNEKTLKMLRYLFFGSMGAYTVYAMMHKRQQALMGSRYVDSNHIVDAVMPFVHVNPIIKPFVEKVAKSMVDEFTGQRDIIDVTPIESDEG